MRETEVKNKFTDYTTSRPFIGNEEDFMFKRPIHNVLTGLGMFGIFLTGWWLWYVFDGSDKAEQRAIEAAQNYVYVTYSNTSFYVVDVMYLSLYDPKYYVRMASKTSADTEFMVRITRSGKVVDDSYEEDVVSKENTYQRISKAYAVAVQTSIGPTFSDRIDIITEIPHSNWEADVENGIDLNDLHIDQPVDLEFYGARYGILFLHAESKSYSYEEVVDVLHELKYVADKNNIHFHSIKLQITIEGTDRYAEGILYDDIDSPYLLERLKQRMDD